MRWRIYALFIFPSAICYRSSSREVSDQNEDRTRQVLFFSGEGSWPLRILRQNPLTFTVAVVLYVFFQMSLAPAQEKTGTVELAELPNPDPLKPPVVITLADAIEQARKVDAHFQSALTDAKLAHEDRTQARNSILPTVSYTSQALLTARQWRAHDHRTIRHQ